MKIKILLVSHGSLAEGIYDSVKFIAGEQENVEVLCAYRNGLDDLDAYVANYLSHFEFSNERLIVVTDLFGGSTTNSFANYLGVYDFQLIAGLNLALVLELINWRQSPAGREITDLVEESKQFIQVVKKEEIAEEDF